MSAILLLQSLIESLERGDTASARQTLARATPAVFGELINQRFASWNNQTELQQAIRAVAATHEAVGLLQILVLVPAAFQQYTELGKVRELVQELKQELRFFRATGPIQRESSGTPPTRVIYTRVEYPNESEESQLTHLAVCFDANDRVTTCSPENLRGTSGNVRYVDVDQVMDDELYRSAVSQAYRELYQDRPAARPNRITGLGRSVVRDYQPYPRREAGIVPASGAAGSGAAPGAGSNRPGAIRRIGAMRR